MSREQLVAARDLIRQKRYDQARAILETVNHPIATEWLSKLDDIAPEVVETPRRSRLPLYALVLVLMVALVGTVVFVASRVLTGSANSASAQSTAALARYFRADTLFYVSAATDEDTIKTLDDLLAKFNVQTSMSVFSVIPRGVQVTLSGFLDMSAQQLLGSDFQTNIRSWLGDGIAFGINDIGIPDQGLVAISITDRTKATAFVEQILPRFGSFTRSEESGYTVFAGTRDSFIAVGNELLCFASRKELLPLAGIPNPSLADSPAFNEMLARLPEDGYQLLFYVDIPSTMRQMADDIGEPDRYEALYQGIGSTGLGFAIQDGHSLVVDYVQRIDKAALQRLGISFEGTGAVDPAFLAYVPADATFVVQATNLAGLYDSIIGFVKGIFSQTQQDPALVDQTVFQMEVLFAGMSGINLREDVLSWMTGDYVAFMTYTPPPVGQLPYMVAPLFPGETFDFNVEGGTIVEVTDPDKAKSFGDKMGQMLTRMNTGIGAAVTHEQIGGVEALVISMPQPGMSAPVETIVAVNDRVFVTGTRKAVTGILSGAGGFDGSARYNRARSPLLDNPTVLWFADSNLVNFYGDAFLVTVPAMDAAFANIIAGLNNEATPQPPDEAQIRAQMTEMQSQVRLLASLFESMTISATSSADGDAMIRLVITMAE